ncbi:MAG TPA: DUF58 domain-containing protein [Bryobacteraceae bacterium]
MTAFRHLREHLAVLWPERRQQVTRTGLVFRITLLMTGIAAFLTANNLLFLILAAMFATLVISGFVTRLGLAGLELDLLLPEHISARRQMRAGIRLRNVKRWVPSFSIHLAGAAQSGFDAILYFPVIPGGATLEESVTLYFPHRGQQTERNFQVSTRFPFGFAERHEMVTLRHDVVVYPCLDPQPGFEALLDSVSGEIAALQRGRGHDFYRIRPYEALESARHVDWKATAHTGALQVREFARDQEWRVTIYLDLDIPLNADAWFESAIECCAFIAHRLTEKAIQIRFRTQELDVTLPDEGNIYRVLRYLALVTPMRGRPPAAPDEAAGYQVVFSANLPRMTELGWGTGDNRTSRLLGLDTLPRTEAEPHS